MPYIKISPATDTSYHFDRVMGMGGNEPVLIKNGNEEYVVKPGGSDLFFDDEAIFKDIRILAKIAKAKALTHINDANLDENWEALLAEYDYSHFLACKELFCARLIRLIAPQCTPEHYLFKRIENSQLTNRPYVPLSPSATIKHEPPVGTTLVGSIFMPDFQTWKSAYKPRENNLIAGLETTPLANIKVNDRRLVLPFVGLGTISVLRYLLGKEDMHDQNWGIRIFDHSVQATIIDFGTCLLYFRFFGNLISKDDNLDINDIFDVAKNLFFEYESSNGVPTLPQELYLSPIVRHEIYATISLLGENLEKIEELIDRCFADFPYHAPFFKAEIGAGIQYLSKFVHDNEKKLNINTPFYTLKSTPSYTLFTSNNTELKGVDYRAAITAFNPVSDHGSY